MPALFQQPADGRSLYFLFPGKAGTICIIILNRPQIRNIFLQDFCRTYGHAAAALTGIRCSRPAVIIQNLAGSQRCNLRYILIFRTDAAVKRFGFHRPYGKQAAFRIIFIVPGKTANGNRLCFNRLIRPDWGRLGPQHGIHIILQRYPVDYRKIFAFICYVDSQCSAVFLPVHSKQMPGRVSGSLVFILFFIPVLLLVCSFARNFIRISSCVFVCFFLFVFRFRHFQNRTAGQLVTAQHNFA